MRSDNGVQDLKWTDDLGIFRAHLNELFGWDAAGLVDVEFLHLIELVGLGPVGMVDEKDVCWR